MSKAHRTLWILMALASAWMAGTAALAATAPGGQTANGCSYKIINGKYFYSCDAKNPSPDAPTPSAVFQDTVPATAAAPAVLTTAAPIAASAAGQATAVAAAPAAPAPAQTMKVVIAPPQTQNDSVRNDEEGAASQGKVVSYKNARDQYFDNTYVGANLGSSSLGAVSGGAFNLGLVLGTNIDENLGLEFGYTYAKQGINMNLAARGGSAPVPSLYGNVSESDADVTNHMLLAEAQYHLTDAYKRLRPFGGFGLAWRKSTLEEKTSFDAYSANAGGTLSQSSIGLTASIGSKFRLSDSLQANVLFRYFLPVSSSTATLSNNPQTQGYMAPTTSSTRLRSTDSEITSSSQYQILAGLQYLF